MPNSEGMGKDAGYRWFHCWYPACPPVSTSFPQTQLTHFGTSFIGAPVGHPGPARTGLNNLENIKYDFTIETSNCQVKMVPHLLAVPGGHLIQLCPHAYVAKALEVDKMDKDISD